MVRALKRSVLGNQKSITLDNPPVTPAHTTNARRGCHARRGLLVLGELRADLPTVARAREWIPTVTGREAAALLCPPIAVRRIARQPALERLEIVQPVDLA